MGKTHTIKNDDYQKDLNKIYPSISYRNVIEDIRNQIEYDVLEERGYGSVLDEIVSLLADTVTSAAETVRINQINIPTEKVRWRLKQLTAEHIEYVISSLERNTTEIKNMRAYLLTALYNSIDTLDTAALYGA
jgi:hypothetical protein